MKYADDSDTNSSGLKASKSIDPGRILMDQGLETWSMIGKAAFAAALGSPRAAKLAEEGFLAGGAIVVAFPYDPRPAQMPGLVDQAGGPEPYLRVGAFASSHLYAALARLLKATARTLAAATDYPYAGFRVAVNSRLPEKALAEQAGLGYRGRSDLLLAHAYGPACILGVLLLPFDPLSAIFAGDATDVLRESGRKRACASCHACAYACPGKAIVGAANSAGDYNGPGLQATYTRMRCIQHWMSTREEPPAALQPAFTGRLYGCDACILACPLSSGAWFPDRPDGSSPASRADALLLPSERRPGAFISSSFFVTAGDDELKMFFRKTALGLSWLGPDLLRRNAALGSFGTIVGGVSSFGLNRECIS